ncbi:glycosyltransferase family 2 protein [Tuwongella immobilis]|uniref:Glycosyltransferase 2-like domain-containing protein n=1 Tax=Tuwongella immobilis TaxID=692036 RepID=A0A6C2YKT3_9BACT|nr:glycosyltransferase family 2 protein [Tuwongella immobilis]VIP01522.1 Putative glycosyltransferase OS=Singulisphaera acidiphila (strain ATCC BAA-1392 / DSM 18658 / VKM B-2454 / MOB10) GN=Sinac_5391 PE=4 SV=1: Glyco_tranf_2_3 [Tuwongella immobilis]VTR98658.1 Putative glycosyltransferase OS=Singulisphaera acidiphila (strain ATCC BAA-1392 / DSM 18658 / VKM B-2454 / MOB10) GN=Sinac_5391 PE=4 SV=1: Glyco_tranf_2_3 [Tuwongella immobilis]
MIANHSPAFAVVIPSHRRVDLLERCLQSLARHAPADCEILVVDDGSPQAIVSQLVTQFPGVRILRNDRPLGFCRAANRGIQATSAPIVHLLNDDTKVQPEWHLAPLEAFSDLRVGSVASLLYYPTPNGDRIDSAGDAYHRGGYAIKSGHGEPLTEAWLQSRAVFGACGAAAWYRRTALEQTGLFPESFSAYFEDVDLAYRLHWAGFTVRYCPESRVLHWGGSSYGQVRMRPKLLRQQSENEEAVFWRNLPPHHKLRSLAWHFAVLAGKSLRRWREGTFAPFAMGRLRALLRLPAHLSHRQSLIHLPGAQESTSWPLLP